MRRGQVGPYIFGHKFHESYSIFPWYQYSAPVNIPEIRRKLITTLKSAVLHTIRGYQRISSKPSPSHRTNIPCEYTIYAITLRFFYGTVSNGIFVIFVLLKGLSHDLAFDDTYG
jgi:hypothetical protein